jgi:hypothetical protein
LRLAAWAGRGFCLPVREFQDFPTGGEAMTRIAWSVMVLALVLWLGGCGGGEEQAAQGEQGDQAAMSGMEETGGVDRYTVLGTISKLPDADGPDKSLYVRHAPIPDYKNADGEVVGMAAMTMPFPVAEGVSLEGVEVGDPVEFTFTMRWKPTGKYEIVELTELPAGTEINFETPMMDEHHGHDHDHSGHDHDHDH